MSSVKNRLLLNSILILSILTLCIAYFIEYFLGHQPCNLCLIERIPYFAAIIFISFALFLNKYEKIISIVVGLFFIFGAIVSIYHVGIEKGIFSESLMCNISNTLDNPTSEEILKELEKKTISCKEVTFSLFGISLATLNTLISILVAGIMFKNLKNYEKN